MENEIPLTGGRITQGVVRIGDTVRRPVKPNIAFVRGVLLRLHEKAPGLAPEYLGQDSSGREILSYLPGAVPSDLGFFTDDQCAEAARIIRRLHDGLSSCPGLPDGSIVCHGDLSPCNFVFLPDLSGMPCGVIDWDAAHIGHPHDDLAYALWMWLDIGNDEQDAAYVRRRILLMLSAYSADPNTQIPPSADSAATNAAFSPSYKSAKAHAEMKMRILREMHRVAYSVFPTPEQTAATRAWALSCAAWTETHL